MTTSIQFGQIIWAELADANGIRKLRPAVVVTPTDRISAAGSLEVVAVTSVVPQLLPTDYVLLPWHARGHPRTGLNRKCAAVCSWVARIALSDVRSYAGLVPGPVLLEIMSKIA
jgi:mRNA-degrading endonuclease toxin of MazEF toxin-antitoxin module